MKKLKIKYIVIGFVSLFLVGMIIVDKRCEYTYDPKVAAEFATNYAEKKSRKLCAYYVRHSFSRHQLATIKTF